MLHFTYIPNQGLTMRSDDKQLQLLTSFLSSFPECAFCELHKAVKDVLSGARKSYHFILNCDSFFMDRSSTTIEMGDPAGSSCKTYETALFQSCLDRYTAEYKRWSGIDLRLLTMEYNGMMDDAAAPVIDPQYWPDSDDEAENQRRISAYNRQLCDPDF